MSRGLPAAVALVGLLASCAGGNGDGGPEILYGADVCDRCRMVISERRHAAAARLDGTVHRFDDPGCMRAFLGEAGSAPEAAWVHDERESWRPVEEAWFGVDPEGRTPMASGILAFGSPESARRAFGRSQRWEQLADRPSG